MAPGPDAPADAGLLRSTVHGRIGAWQLSLLAVVVAICVYHLVLASRVTEIEDNDGAYYYGVARHMARTGRFAEPITWHFIRPPAHIEHAPFDYWGCMTSLLLVPSMVIFGATPETAILTISAISAASLLAFWYLVCVALPLRYWAAQLLAVGIFALTPTMTYFRVQPESTVVAQLFILLSLIAFCRRRFVASLLSGFCILLTRADGLILFGIITVANLIEVRKSAAEPRQRFWRLLLVGLLCVTTYVAWSLISFGTVAPPGSQTLPFLSKYEQVFDYGVTHQRSLTTILGRLQWDALATRMDLALQSFRAIPFAPPVDYWLGLAIISGFGLFLRPSAAVALIWVLCFGSYFFLAWVAGPGFAPQRTAHTFVPLVVLTGAIGVDTVLAILHRWVAHGRLVTLRVLLVSAGIVATCWFFFDRLDPFRVFPQGYSPLRRAELAQLDQVMGGAPVASNAPWFMIASTRSPAVSIPYNGEAAIAAVLERYQARWLVIVGRPPLWVQGESRRVLSDVLSGRKANVGQFRLEPVPGVSAYAVFRVRAPSSSNTAAEPP